ncbi:MAG: LysR family transcriptional regulator [Candidatus Eremiobacteraeota bacterium]|nr:LysR family transcriptional regulator [Candidatus Eremiobacteraeota bacterium]MCW5868581.1 LysR family transcriptional regulator [Candidatus Eremiobacteraeota bacterium]
MPFTSDSAQLFLSVLDHGSFSAAARALGRVPSAVSMQVAQLEAELDLVLFERSTREVKPTQVALTLEPEARQLARQLRRLQQQALNLHQGLERRLTLAVAPELLSAPWNLPLAVLAEEFPSLEVEVLSAPQTAILRWLHDREADLAVLFERVGIDEREAFQEFASEVLIAVVAPTHSMAGHSVRPDDLLDNRQVAVASRETRGIDPRLLVSRKLWRTDSHLAALSLVQAGLGWAYLPRRLVEPYIAAGNLMALQFENMSNQIRLWVDVVWLRDPPQGLGARRFIELMRAAKET